MEIGKRLKLAREAIGYTLKKASEESGIGESSLSEFENEKREPKFSQLSKISEIYRRTIEFFLSDTQLVENVMLWREKPSSEEERKQTEAKFRQLCQQYYSLELCMGEKVRIKFPEPNIDKPEDFSYAQAESFAQKVQKEFCLGDIPSASLKRKLEETYYVKIFHLDFPGSAISTVDDFGPAVLLNAKNRRWRRNYDLAHELFHILTWQIFRHQASDDTVCCESEDKLANAFASRLLMPGDSLGDKIKSTMDTQGQITFDQLENIAREFDVSLDALICRIAYMFKLDTSKCRDAARRFMQFNKPRDSDSPPELPERYSDLAVHALREGRLSLIQFAKYMGISYKKAQEYLIDDEDFKDEKITIPVA